MFLILTLILSCQTDGKPDPADETESRLLRERSAAIVAAEAGKNIDSVLTYYAEDAVIQPAGFDSAGTRTEDIGKYLTVWRKVDGEWKIVAVTFSGDRPPA